MYYVYILRSEHYADKLYTGYTTDVSNRLQHHNAGAVPSTKQFVPWKLIWHCCVADETKAIAFEKYLKTASGIAFRNKRFI